jgi:hypothetical protein
MPTSCPELLEMAKKALAAVHRLDDARERRKERK